MHCSVAAEDSHLPNMAKDFYESCCIRLNPETDYTSPAQKRRNSVCSDASSCRSKVTRKGCQEPGQSEKDETDEEEPQLWGESPAELRKRLWRALMDAAIDQKCEEDDADELVPYHPVHSPFSVRPRFMRYSAEPRTITTLLGSPDKSCGYQHKEESGNHPTQKQHEEQERLQEEKLEKLPAQLEEENNSTAELVQSRPEEEGGTEKNQKVSEFAPSMPLAKRIFLVVASVLAMTICISAAKPALFPSLYENRPEPAVELLRTLESIWPDITWLPCSWLGSDSQRQGSYRNRSLAASKKSMDSAPAIQEILVSAVAAVDRVPFVLHKVGKQIIEWCKAVCAHLSQDLETKNFPPTFEQIWGCSPQPEMSVNTSLQNYSVNFSKHEKTMQSIVTEAARDGSKQSSELVGLSNDLFCEKEQICYQPIDAQFVLGSLKYSQVRLEDFYRRERQEGKEFIDDETFTLKGVKTTYESQEGTDAEEAVEVDHAVPLDLGETGTNIMCMTALQETSHLVPLNRHLKPASERQPISIDDLTAFEKPEAPISDESHFAQEIANLAYGEDEIANSAGTMEGNVAVVKGETKKKMGGEAEKRNSLFGCIRQSSTCGWTGLMAVLAGIFCMLSLTLQAMAAFLRQSEQPLGNMLDTPLPVSSRNSTSPDVKTIFPMLTECAASLSAFGSYMEYVESPGKLTPVRRSRRLRSLALSPSSHKPFLASPGT